MAKTTSRSSGRNLGDGIPASARADEVRTTLSIRGDLGSRLNAIARAGRLTPLQVVRRAIEEWVELTEREGAPAIGKERSALAEGREMLSEMRGFRNPYQEIVAAWRLKRTRSHVAAIAGHHLELDAWNAEDYLLRVLRELTDRLGERDEVLILSNATFWNAADSPNAASPFGHDSATRYLAAQEAAIGRGVGLSRVLLLSRDELFSRFASLEQQRQFLEQARRTAGAHVRVCCRIYPDAAVREAARAALGHFALIRRRATAITEVPSRDPDVGAMIVEPVYLNQDSSRIVKLRFQFSRGPGDGDPIVREYVNHFFEADRGAVPIDTLRGHDGQYRLENIDANAVS
jgi:hypothetical protein